MTNAMQSPINIGGRKKRINFNTSAVFMIFNRFMMHKEKHSGKCHCVFPVIYSLLNE